MYILSNQQKKFFDVIFNILINENNDNNLRKEVNLLINMICTNEKLKNIVICLNQDWEKFFKEENNDYIIFYIFQILESQIQNFQNDKKNLEKRNWIKKFLENKNEYKYFDQEKFRKLNMKIKIIL